MTRSSRRAAVAPAVPATAAVLLLARQLSMVNAGVDPSAAAFAFPDASSLVSAGVSRHVVGRCLDQGALGPRLYPVPRSSLACSSRRSKQSPSVASRGIGPRGALAGATATTAFASPRSSSSSAPSSSSASSAAGHSEEQSAWLGRIEYYGGREMWRKAEGKFQQMQDEGVRPTLTICNVLMEAYLNGGRYANAMAFLEDLCLGNVHGDAAATPAAAAAAGGGLSAAGGLSIDADGSVIAVAAAAAEPEAASSSSAASSAPTPIAPDLRTFNLALASLASAGKWKKALDVSAPMRASSASGGASGSDNGSDGRRGGVGGGRGRGGERGRGRGGKAGRGGGGASASSADGALKAVAAGLAADGETYTHLVVACGKGGEPDRARLVFDEMRAGGISPPPEATAALIRALAKGGRGSTEALRLLGDMQASAGAGGRVQRRSPGGGGGDGGGWEDRDAVARNAGFGGAIEACAVHGEWQKAVSLLDEMREARMSPDSRCYGNAMRACATGGNWQLALALLNTMKKEGVTRTAFNFNIAMQACRKAGRNGKAISLLAEMEKDKVAPDIVTYNTCVTIAGQAGRLDEALELLRKASEVSGLELDVVSYRAALGGLRREKRWEAAVKLLGDMQRRGLGHDEVSTAMAMNTCVAAQQPRRALDLFRDMRDVGRVFPRLPSVTALLEALADLGRWEEALRELRALSASGVKPDGRAIAYTMSACNSAKKWDQTLSLQHYADKMGIEITMDGLVLVARAHSARKDWQGVVGVLAAAEQACSAAAAAAAADTARYGDDGGGGGGGGMDVPHPPAELYEVVARALALAGMWEEAAGAVRRLEKLPPRRAGQRAAAASLSTYELILGAAAAAGRDDSVLSEADAARAALREADAPSDAPAPYGADTNRGSSGGRGGELNPGGLAHEVAAAGRLGQWDRVSPLMAKAMRSPSLRGVAGARIYAALIGAAAACGKPERGLEVFREMADDAAAAAAAAAAATPAGKSGGGGGGGGGVGEAGVGAGGGLGLGSAEGRRLPPPDAATFMAALDACAAIGGEESVALAVGVTKEAAAAARQFQGSPEEAEEGEDEESSSSRGSGSGSGSGAAKKMSSRNLAAVLSRAGEVCASAGKASTAQALTAKASELMGLPPPPPPTVPTAVTSVPAAATASSLAPGGAEDGAPGEGVAILDGGGEGGGDGGEVARSDEVAAAAGGL